MRKRPSRFRDDMTLLAARVLLNERVEEGVTCPVCNQFAKVYRRSVHSTMARDLIALYKASPTGRYIHVPTVLGYNGGDALKCAYWSLLEPQEGNREDGSNRNGYWRLTYNGKLFVNDHIRIRKYAYVYDSSLLRLDGPLVSIADCLGKKFNYQELMNS